MTRLENVAAADVAGGAPGAEGDVDREMSERFGAVFGTLRVGDGAVPRAVPFGERATEPLPAVHARAGAPAQGLPEARVARLRPFFGGRRRAASEAEASEAPGPESLAPGAPATEATAPMQARAGWGDVAPWAGEGARPRGAGPLGVVDVDRPHLDLAYVDVEVPVLFESFEGVRRCDLMPQLRPAFSIGGEPVNWLYSGIDYLLGYYSVPHEAAPPEAMSPVGAITLAGCYRLVVTGISERLEGTKIVPFTVQRHERLCELVASWLTGLG